MYVNKRAISVLLIYIVRRQQCLWFKRWRVWGDRVGVWVW